MTGLWQRACELAGVNPADIDGEDHADELLAAAEQFDLMNAMLTRHGFPAGQAGIKALLMAAGVDLRLAPAAADMEAVPRGQV